jgi:hypothetical protein
MKKSTFRRIAAVLFVFALGITLGTQLAWPRGPVPEGKPTQPPTGSDWIDLLSPENAKLWRNLGDTKNIFEVQENSVHIYGKTIYPLRYVTFTGETFSDFDLHIEYKLARGTNSGVFLRAEPNDPVYRGFEVQVIDDFGKAPTKNGAGAIYDVATPMFNMSRPAGEWNSFDIGVTGQRVKIVFNGWLVVDADLSKMDKPIGKFKVAYKDLPLTGNIALQDHGGEVWYRNILVRRTGSSTETDEKQLEK